MDIANSQNNKLVLQIQNSRQKLKTNFPIDPRSDIQVIFKSKKYKLQKAHLRLYSGYFKKSCTGTLTTLRICQNFKQKQFEEMLSTLYGFTVAIQKSQIYEYYSIAAFLQIQCILRLMKKQILSNIANFSVFNVMRIANKYSEQQLFQACHDQLIKEEFEQLKYQKSEFFDLELSLVKNIIKTLKKYKIEFKKGLSYIQIDQLIQQYCVNNSLSQDQFHELKFQLFDVHQLNSQQYKSIFLDQMNKEYSKAGLQNSFSTNLQNLDYQSKMANNATNQLKLGMQNTFQKKRNNQLQQQNVHLQSQLSKLKKLTNQNEDIHEQMHQQLKMLRTQLLKKQHQTQSQSRMINKFQKMFGTMQGELQRKTKQIDTLSKKFDTFKNNNPNANSQSINVQNNIFVQSQFLPAHLIQNIMSSPNSKEQKQNIGKKSQQYVKLKKTAQSSQLQNLDDQQLEQIYQDRIYFDEQPVSIFKRQIPKLSLLLASKGFSKKKLNIVFRRSRNYKQKETGSRQSIFNKQSLLVLINSADLHFGGFVSKLISQQKVNYMFDPEAFVFSLSKNKKYGISPLHQNQAIFIAKEYLIAFSNDLMIAKNCLVDKNYCFWPKHYTLDKKQYEQGPQYLAGSKQFVIDDIQIYQVLQEQMQMFI